MAVKVACWDQGRSSSGTAILPNHVTDLPGENHGKKPVSPLYHTKPHCPSLKILQKINIVVVNETLAAPRFSAAPDKHVCFTAAASPITGSSVLWRQNYICSSHRYDVSAISVKE